MTVSKIIIVKDRPVSIIEVNKQDYISLTDMINARDGDFFVADWLRNRNTLEYLGIWESVNNTHFNYGKFAIIKSKAGFFPPHVSPPGSVCKRTRSLSGSRKLRRYGSVYFVPLSHDTNLNR